MSDGEVRYLQIPAADVEESAAFYQSVFGSRVTPQGEGEAIATFRDPAGNMLGVFHQNRR